MRKEIREYLGHIEQRKEYWFGKDEYIYRFYEGQYVLLKDLIIKGLLIMFLFLSGCAIPLKITNVPLKITNVPPQLTAEPELLKRKIMASFSKEEQYFLEAMMIEPVIEEIPEAVLDAVRASSIYVGFKESDYATLAVYINETNRLGLHTITIDKWYKRVLLRAEMLRKVPNGD